MSENRKDPSTETAPEIRIERMNTDKSRKDVGSDAVYHVYFELSGHPPPEWTSIFRREWSGLNQTEEVGIDGAFLVLHCELHDVAATRLPLLKKAVAATNEVYRRFAQEAATASEHRQDAWEKERKDVDAVAASLRFD